MSFLNEVLLDVLEEDEDDSFPGDELEVEQDEDDSFPGDESEVEQDEDDVFSDDEDDSFPGDESDVELDDENSEEIDDVADAATEDPDRQGMIRNVDGAHLVYKRKQPDGTFEELWFYLVNDLQQGMKNRKAVLAGTDINMNTTSSEDGDQHYVTWGVGNGECLNIKGLPN